MNPKKCSLATSEVKYLGYIVNGQGVRVDPDKVNVILNFPTPRNVKELKSFLGMVGYWRRWIKGLSEMIAPLNHLTSKNVPYQWSQECQDSFNKVKSALVNPPILSYPNFDGSSFILQTDASKHGLGFILSQIQKGEEKVLSYGSRATSDVESRYSATELEALAVVAGIKRYHPYFQFGQKFFVLTDHAPLVALFNSTHFSGDNASHRLSRFHMFVSQYNFEMMYVKGKENHVDLLSRVVSPCTPTEAEIVLNDEDDFGIANLFVEPENSPGSVHAVRK